MKHHLNSIFSYISWACWSIITGGCFLIAAFLAPLTFFKLPLLIPDSSQIHHYSTILMTSLFSAFVPACLIAFLISTMLEQTNFRNDFRDHRVKLLCRETLLLAGLIIWGALALVVVPEMSEMVFGKDWQNPATRVLFREQHVLSTNLVKAGLLITLIIPWVSNHSHLLNSDSRT
ncbi:MAG: hypothetical protein HQM11_10505 [SAR324 cluster bacterium]|nr:hypothetical protein [SAR324 cluster bacterium]